MNPDLAIAFAGFCFVSSITPGPNNLMLLASAANFGVRRSLPHMFGIALGFTLMIILIGLGLVQLFDRFPVINLLLKVFSVIYLLWLAWKIAHAAAPSSGRSAQAGTVAGRPFTFLQAAAFQWVNPKAWAMALTAVTVYASDKSLASVLVIASIFGIINLPCITVWAWLGQALRQWLAEPSKLRIFNSVMALLLVLSLFPVLFNG